MVNKCIDCGTHIPPDMIRCFVCTAKSMQREGDFHKIEEKSIWGEITRFIKGIIFKVSRWFRR